MVPQRTRAVPGSRRAKGRIFLVLLDTLEHQRWPVAFEGLLGYPFFEQSVEGNPRTLGTPAADDPCNRLYFQQLDDLSIGLAKKLFELKDAAMPSESPGLSTEPLITDDSPAVFLSEVTPDFAEVRDNVRRYLQQADIRVLPETYYDRTPEKYRSTAQTDLDQSLLYVQLLGQFVWPKPPDLPKGYESMELDVAEEKSVPILRWHAPESDTASIKDQQLLERTEVMVMGLEEFKREIVKAVKKHQAVQKMPAIDGEVFVLVNASSLDEQATETIGQVFDAQGIGYEIVNEGENIGPLLEGDDVHGLMVVYGQCEQQWAKRQVRMCRKLLLKKKQPAPVCAVYIGPPIDKPALGIRLPQVPLLDHQDPNLFATFLSAAQEKLTST